MAEALKKAGLYINADGKGYHDANGNEIPKAEGDRIVREAEAAQRELAKEGDPGDQALRQPKASSSTAGARSEAARGDSGPTSTISGKSAEELDALTKEELVEIAGTIEGLVVERLNDRGKPEEGEPLKRDYVRALSASK